MFRVLHAKVGNNGYICQKKVFDLFWMDVGHAWGYGTTINENGCGTELQAIRRMNDEIERYKTKLKLADQKRQFKPKVVKEWP